MGIVLNPSSSGRLSLKGFVDHVRQVIDLHEPDSLIGLASPLCMLANDPDVVARHFNDVIQRSLDTESPPPEVSSSVPLAVDDHFVLTANVWMPASLGEHPPPNGIPAGRVHNHSASLMTVGYAGPGCELDLYTYDPKTSQGEIGERADLRFVRTHAAVAAFRRHLSRDGRCARPHRAVESFGIAHVLRRRRTFATQRSTPVRSADGNDCRCRSACGGASPRLGRAAGRRFRQRRNHRSSRRPAAPVALPPCPRSGRRCRHAPASRPLGERTRVIERALRDSSELVRRRAELAAAQLTISNHPARREYTGSSERHGWLHVPAM